MRLMDSPADFTGPINLGNPNEMTIRELAEAVVELSGSKSKIVYLPLPSGRPEAAPAQTSARQEAQLKWQPTVVLREGLEKTIAYFDGILISGSDVQSSA